MVPPATACFAIQHTILVIAISCKGQEGVRVPRGGKNTIHIALAGEGGLDIDDCEERATVPEHVRLARRLQVRERRV